MPWMVRLAPMLLGVLLLTSGCARPGLFKRPEPPRLLDAGPRIGTKRPESPRLADAGPRIGSPAPDFEGEDFDGRPVKLSDQRGKVVVMIFWATWCPPCRAMIPHEREMAARLQGKPFTLISVNNDSDEEAALKTIAKERMTWTHIKTGGGANPINERYRVRPIPAIFVIDQKGILRACGTHLRGEELERAVETLLEEP